MWQKRKHIFSLNLEHGDNQKNPKFFGFCFGASQGIRTPDLSFRRRTLYPAELATHIYFFILLIGEVRSIAVANAH